MRTVESFSIGSVLKAGLSTYFRNFPLFGLLSVIAFVPYFVFRVWAPDDMDPLSAYGLVDALLGIICITLVQGGLTFAVVSSLRGSAAVDLWTVSARSLAVLPRIIAVSVLISILIAIGFLLLIVPGIIVALMLFVAVPASVMEGGVGKALKRSAALTKGHKGALFGLSIVLSIPMQAAAVLMVLTVLPRLGPTTGAIVDLGMQCFFGGILGACGAVAYHDLRIVKEGVDTESIAAVFD